MKNKVNKELIKKIRNIVTTRKNTLSDEDIINICLEFELKRLRGKNG